MRLGYKVARGGNKDEGIPLPACAPQAGRGRKPYPQNPGTACSRQPPSRTEPTRAASPVSRIGLHRDPAQRRRARRRLEARRRDTPGKALQRLVLGHADHRVVVAGHADIADEGGAAGQDAQVGGRRVGMGAGDEARAAVAEKAHRLLLAGRLRVHVDHDGVGRPAAAGRR